MKNSYEIGTRLGAQVRDFSAISRNETGITSRYLEITSSLVFNLLEEQKEDITLSLRVLKNISRVSAPFELFYDEYKSYKMAASQRRFVFVECYVVKLLSWVA